MANRSTVLAVASLLVALSAPAVTLRVADQGDVQSLDPHSALEGVQLGCLSNVYEPLIGRDQHMKLSPLLATRWTLRSPTVWRFELRRGVTFHDGTPFTADDVVFSFRRAADQGSALKVWVSTVKEVRKIDDHTVDIETIEPNPIFPDTLTGLYMMSKNWCEANNAERPADRLKGIENVASFKGNGTGLFRIKERQPTTRTVIVRNFAYWEKVEGNVDEVVFTPIGNDSTRLAALMSAAVDVAQPVPLQDVERVKASGMIDVLQAPEFRTVFLGMDLQRDELLFSNIKGKNPFKDPRVCLAVYQAIDEETIKTKVMRNAATPAALLIGPGVRGFQPDMNRRLPFDPAGARRLLADAGYPDGFEVTLNCPNDRLVNDVAICQAVAANLARVGVKVDLQTETKLTYFPRLLRRQTSFYLMSWVATTFDAHDALLVLVGAPNDKGRGQYNVGGYSNPIVDDLITKIESEFGETQRDALIRQAFKIIQDDVVYIPLHQQALAWGVAKHVSLTLLPNNQMYFKWVRVDPGRTVARSR